MITLITCAHFLKPNHKSGDGLMADKGFLIEKDVEEMVLG
jgi:hypothetical protein